MNTKIIPSISSKDAAKDYDVEKWKNYARRMQKNNFMRNVIFLKYKGVCQWCGRKINSQFHLHHKDYRHQCISNKQVKQQSTWEY